MLVQPVASICIPEPQPPSCAMCDQLLDRLVLEVTLT